MKKPARGWFIAGTDTDVGKTYVACRMLERLRARGERVGAYKPVASGASEPQLSDAHRLWLAIGGNVPEEWVNPQSFAAPLAPPVAAEQENREVNDELLLAGVERWYGQCDTLLVEGAGGLMSPVTWSKTNADLARAIGYPLVIVARNRLGVVHQILATCEAAENHGLTINEIVLNEVTPEHCDAAVTTNERLLRPFLDKYFRGTAIRRETYAKA